MVFNKITVSQSSRILRLGHFYVCKCPRVWVLFLDTSHAQISYCGVDFHIQPASETDEFMSATIQTLLSYLCQTCFWDISVLWRI